MLTLCVYETWFGVMSWVIRVEICEISGGGIDSIRILLSFWYVR